MFRVELAKARRRWRTYLIAMALGGIPVLIVIAVKLSPPHSTGNGDAPPFLMQIVRNGLFAPLTGLAVIQPFFLPLAAGLFAGDAIAGEAQAGTLRYLLVRPVRRTRLVLAKYASTMTLLGLLLLWVVGCGAFWGGVIFGFHPMPTLSGSTLSIASASLRITRLRRLHPPRGIRDRGDRAVHLDAHGLGAGRDGCHGHPRHRERDRRQHPQPSRDPRLPSDARLARVHRPVPLPRGMGKHARWPRRERGLHIDLPCGGAVRVRPQGRRRLISKPVRVEASRRP